MEAKTDLRIIKTHKALCETFMQICSEKDFEDITVGELCERSMVRRATFYKHFSDKYDFFAFFVRYVQDQFITRFEIQKEKQKEQSQTNDFYTFLFEGFSTFLVEHKSMVNCIRQSTAFATLLDIMTDEIKKNVYIHLLEQKGESSVDGTDLMLLSYFFAGGVLQLYRYWLTNEKTVSKDDIFNVYKKLVEQIFKA